MNRRNLLKGMGAATAASLWPGWLSEAFAGPPCGVLKGAVTLSAAIQAAHAAAQPLLVFVIPKDDGQKWDRGRHFGEWLNHGTDADLAPLACAGVVCADMGAVRQLFPSAPADQEPAILAVDVERAPAQVSVAMPGFSHPPLDLDQFSRDREDSERLPEEQRKAYVAGRLSPYDLEDQQVTSCIASTGQAVRQAVLDDRAALQRRADAAWERLSASDREVARRILAGGSAAAEEVLAVAPLLAKASSERGGDAKLLKILAAAARARYAAQRIPGSKWANADGCGETIEGEEDNIAFGCGMGHVPRRSQRFLYFFTRSPYLPTE